MNEKKLAKRKKVPKRIALATEGCTGCGTSPVCQDYCPVEGAMVLRPARDGTHFHRMWIDADLCIGCARCIGRGPQGNLLYGCQWGSIVMIDNPDFGRPEEEC